MENESITRKLEELESRSRQITNRLETAQRVLESTQHDIARVEQNSDKAEGDHCKD